MAGECTDHPQTTQRPQHHDRVVWAFLALMILDAIVRGSWDTLGTFLPPLGLIGWLVFVLLWRPALIVGTERVIIREILRTTTVPLADISDIRLSTVPEHRLAARTNRGGANIRSHRLGDGSLLHPAVDRLLSVQSIER